MKLLRYGGVGAEKPGILGGPDECVGAYLFLACDQLSSFITGQSLEVNGGWVMP